MIDGHKIRSTRYQNIKRECRIISLLYNFTYRFLCIKFYIKILYLFLFQFIYFNNLFILHKK